MRSWHAIVIDTEPSASAASGDRHLRRRADDRRPLRAGTQVLRQAIPGVRIVGLFIARRVPEAVDFSDFDELL